MSQIRHNIVCPNCSKQFDVEAEQLRGTGLRLLCDGCGKLFGLADTDNRRTVLVVHDSDETYAIIDTIVREAGFASMRAKGGAQALSLLGSKGSRFIIVDVALADMYAFELVGKVKEQGKENKPFIVLLASVYDKTAYKRAPKSLYGADDYLEQHHLPDKLPVLLAKAFATEAPAVDAARTIARRSSLRQAAGEDLFTIMSEGLDDESEAKLGREAYKKALSERARKLARRLVLDISLYHEEQFLEGLRSGKLHELLAKPIGDAKKFLKARLPDGMRDKLKIDFVEEALAELVSSKGAGR